MRGRVQRDLGFLLVWCDHRCALCLLPDSKEKRSVPLSSCPGSPSSTQSRVPVGRTSKWQFDNTKEDLRCVALTHTGHDDVEDDTGDLGVVLAKGGDALDPVTCKQCAVPEVAQGLFAHLAHDRIVVCASGHTNAEEAAATQAILDVGAPTPPHGHCEEVVHSHSLTK